MSTAKVSKPAGSTGNRPQLTRSAVLVRAYAIADAEGLAAVSIRRIAQELGVTPMALYWHFKSKDELLDALGDDILGTIGLDLDAATPWPEQLRAIVGGLVAAFRSHPSLANLAAGRIVACEHGLELTERTLAMLRSAGFTVSEAANVAHQALYTAIMLCSTEPGTEVGVVEHDAVLEQKRTALTSLPADRYPHVIEAAGDLIDCADQEFYYDSGIDLFVAGVEGLRERSSSSPR